jgi:hypothetical protein
MLLLVIRSIIHRGIQTRTVAWCFRVLFVKVDCFRNFFASSSVEILLSYSSSCSLKPQLLACGFFLDAVAFCWLSAAAAAAVPSSAVINVIKYNDDIKNKTFDCDRYLQED